MSEKIDDITGKQIALTDGRCVFMSEQTGCWFVEFRSREGSITRLCLSDDAVNAFNVLTTGIKLDGFKPERTRRQKQQEARWQLCPRIEA